MATNACHFLDRYFRPAVMLRAHSAEGADTAPSGFFGYNGLTLHGPCIGARPELPVTAAIEVAISPDDPLPFDLDGVTDSLRLERYAKNGADSSDGFVRSFARKSYYLLRPLFPVTFRKHLQKRYLGDWRSLTFPSWPVDFTVDRLARQMLGRAMVDAGLDKLQFIWFWPDGYNAGLLMTHDVETANGRDYCLELVRRGRDHGLHPSLQIIPEVRYQVADQLLADWRDLGAEINVHGLNHDGRLFDSSQEFSRRAPLINAHARRLGARGFRSPILYRNPDWLHQLDFEFDMSFPNVAHLDPQRGGCCTVLPYFIGNMVELPLTTIQDYSLFHILGEYSCDIWKDQLSKIVAENGLVTFNVHPDYVSDYRATKVFDELLHHLAEAIGSDHLWSARPSEVSDWWRARSAMRITRVNGMPEVVGPGSERARIATAHLNSGQVTYVHDI